MDYANNPFLSRGLASTTLHPLGLEVTEARGPWIHLADGTQLFDAISGIGVSNFGHGNPGSPSTEGTTGQAPAHHGVRGVCARSPNAGERASPRNTAQGFERGVFSEFWSRAIDAALKLARRATGRPRILAVEGSYHGNTLGSLSVSSNESRKAPIGRCCPKWNFSLGTTLEISTGSTQRWRA